MTREQALAIATTYDIPLDQDFHVLCSSTVDRIIAAADLCRYRTPRDANGSRARYFQALLCRSAARKESTP